LTPTCAGILESRGSGLGLLKFTFNAESFMCRLSSSISSHFGAIHFWNACCRRNCKKFTKNLILEVQGHSRSWMLTFLKSSSPVLVMISSMSVLICNHFYDRRANSGRITSFRRGAPFSHHRSRGTPSPSGMKFGHKILIALDYHMVETRSLCLIWAPIGTGTCRT